MDRYDVAICSDSDPGREITETLGALLDNQWQDDQFAYMVAHGNILGDVSTVQLTASATQVGRWVQICQGKDVKVSKWKSLQRCAFTATVPQNEPTSKQKPCSCGKAWQQVCSHFQVSCFSSGRSQSYPQTQSSNT